MSTAADDSEDLGLVRTEGNARNAGGMAAADAPSGPLEGPLEGSQEDLPEGRQTLLYGGSTIKVPSPRPPDPSPESPDEHHWHRPSAEPAIGTSIGRFMVLGTLGRGGMGTVYETFDRTLDRRVAVKVLHHGVAPDHQERLVREAKALAQLSHPCVVQVYEVGEFRGQSFVAMELVRGLTLRKWQTQNPRPDWRACVKVYLQAGAGLAAAHERGLVHRDFKPGNAIVDDKGRVRVLDFGLARTADDHSTRDPQGLAARQTTEHGDADELPTGGQPLAPLTESGMVMGTPAYMPLEQMHRGEIDARSDQFSFCVSLFEAVYGVRPFVGRSVDEIRAKLSGIPTAPEPRNTKIPSRLREVLVRGLAAKPEDRWPSMEVLLDQLRALVAPRRRTRSLALGGVALLGLAAGGTGLVYTTQVAQRCTGGGEQFEGIWDEARAQQVHDAITATQVSYAADTWARVDTTLHEYAEAWASTHTEVCEATAVRHEQSEHEMELRMACLRARKIELRTTVDMLARTNVETVEKAVELVEGLPSLSRCDDVERLADQRQRVPPPEDPDVARKVELLREQLDEVRATRTAGAYDEAIVTIEPLVEQALALDYPPVAAEAVLGRGLVRIARGSYAEAEEDLGRAYALAVAADHEEIELAAATSLTHMVGSDLQRHAEGLQWGRVVVPLAKRLGDPSHIARSIKVLGLVYKSQGDYAQAETLLRRAVQIQEDTLGPDHPDLAETLGTLANVLSRVAKHDEAIALHQRGQRIEEHTVGPAHPHVAGGLIRMGNAQMARGALEEAEQQFRRALDIYEGSLPEAHPHIAIATASLAAALAQQKKYSDAIVQFQRALELFEQAFGPDHPHLTTTRSNLAGLLIAQGKFGQAELQLRRGLLDLERTVGADHPEIATISNNLALSLQHQGKLAEAETFYRQSLEKFESTVGPAHPKVAGVLTRLATISVLRREFAAAREEAARALSIHEKAEVAPKELATARFVLARALWPEVARRAYALALAEQARDGFAELGVDAQPDHAEVEAWLAEHRT